VREFLRGEAHPEARWLSFDDSKPEGGERTSIVGVVRDIRQDGIQQKIAPRVYVPLTQKALDLRPIFWCEPPCRRRVRPLSCASCQTRRGHRGDAMGTVRQRIDDSIFETRLLATLGGFFGVLALLLAAVGLYGVMSYGMAKRAGEIGIRMALGPDAPMCRHGAGDALLLVAGGSFSASTGLAAARAVHSLLFGIDAVDPLAFAVPAPADRRGVGAAFLPAHRAASIDPMRALRHE